MSIYLWSCGLFNVVYIVNKEVADFTFVAYFTFLTLTENSAEVGPFFLDIADSSEILVRVPTHLVK